MSVLGYCRGEASLVGGGYEEGLAAQSRDKDVKGQRKTLLMFCPKKNIARIVNAVHCHSQLSGIVGKKWDHRILDPLFFSGKIRKNT